MQAAPPRVLIGCCDALDNGAGILNYTREISIGLIEKGYEVHLAVPVGGGANWADAPGMVLFPTSQDADQRSLARRLLDYCNESNVTCVINNDNSVVQSIAPGLRCPFIAVGHSPFRRTAALACFQPEWSDYIISISTDMEREFLKRGIPADRSVLLLSGVADPGYRPRPPRKIDDPLRLLFVGGDSPIKGADILARIVLAPDFDWSSLELTWCGTMSGEFRQRISSSPHIRVSGQLSREAVIGAMARADVLLFPSRYEGCPIALLEAISQGMAAIVSDGHGAMRDIIRNGSDGMILPLSSWPSGLGQLLSRLRDDSELTMHLQTTARRRYEAEFRVTRMVDALIDLAARPQVDRGRPLQKLEVLQWHRPLLADGIHMPLLDRLLNRVGVLRRAGRIDMEKAS